MPSRMPSRATLPVVCMLVLSRSSQPARPAARPTPAAATGAATATTTSPPSVLDDEQRHDRRAPTTPTGTSPATATSTAPAPDALRRAPPGSSTASTPTSGPGSCSWSASTTDASRTSLDRLVARRHLGGVILLGGWGEGASARPRRRRATSESGLADGATAGLGLLIAADQEGGAVQQLKGEGFSTDPVRPRPGPGHPRRARGGRHALGPASSPRPASTSTSRPSPTPFRPRSARATAPIGQYGRQFSSDPERVAAMVPAFIAGMRRRRGGQHRQALPRHRPHRRQHRRHRPRHHRHARRRSTTPTSSPSRPASTPASSSSWSARRSTAKLDPGTNAAFSKPIVTDLLRGRLGWTGVVITDDVGAAKAVSAVPGGRSGPRGSSMPVATSSSAPRRRRSRRCTTPSRAGWPTTPPSPPRSTAAVTRVLTLKVELGLATCS